MFFCLSYKRQVRSQTNQFDLSRWQKKEDGYNIENVGGKDVQSWCLCCPTNIFQRSFDAEKAMINSTGEKKKFFWFHYKSIKSSTINRKRDKLMVSKKNTRSGVKEIEKERMENIGGGEKVRQARNNCL